MKRAPKKRGAEQPRREPSPGVGVEEGILLGLVLLEPLLFTPWTRNPFAAKDLLVGAAVLALAVARLVALRAGRVSGGVPIPVVAALGAVVAVHLALTPGSRAPALSVAHTARLLGYCSLFILVSSRAWSADFFRRFFGAVLAGTVVASLYAYLQAAHLDPVSWADSFRVAGAPLFGMRMFSTFGHPNFFGSHLAMSLVLIGALALQSRSRVPQAAAVAGGALGASCLALTLNRGAWVGFAAGVAVAAGLAWWTRRRAASQEPPGGAGGRTRAFKSLAGVAGAAALLAVALSPAVRQRLDFSKVLAEPTVRSRLLIWSGAAATIRDRPLVGHGPGTFGSVFPSYRSDALSDYHDELIPVTHAHNEYLEIAAETGVLGLLALLGLLGIVLKRGLDAVRRAQSREEAVVPIALLSACAVILASNLFGVDLRHVNASLFLWLLLGLIAADPARKASSAALRPSRSALVVFAAAGALVCALFTLRMFAGETRLRRAERSLAAGNYADAAILGRSAHAWYPAEPAGLMLAAEAMVAAGDHAGAREFYREVARMNPGEPLIDYDLALMEYLTGNFDAGLARMPAARRLHPRHVPTRSLHYDLWLKKGLDLAGRGDLSGAKEAFREAGLMNHNDPRAIFYLGNVHVKEGLLEAAIDRYELALRKDPAFTPAAENLKQVRALLGR